MWIATRTSLVQMRSPKMRMGPRRGRKLKRTIRARRSGLPIRRPAERGEVLHAACACAGSLFVSDCLQSLVLQHIYVH